VLWDLAPHDISILMHVLDERPVLVSARGSACVYAGVHDVCYLELQFESGASAHVHPSWLDPNKVRRLTLVGDRRMAVFDDVSSSTKLRIYDRGVERPDVDNYGEFEVAYRHGEIVIPYIAWREPLRLECEHFLECVRSGGRPLTDGEWQSWPRWRRPSARSKEAVSACAWRPRKSRGTARNRCERARRIPTARHTPRGQRSRTAMREVRMAGTCLALSSCSFTATGRAIEAAR
jgi:predicted dehydrogenase